VPPEPRPTPGPDPLDLARQCSRRLTREERHHLEIVMLALRGDVASASALAREHLIDFPYDAVVARLLTGWEDQ
jgi:DNA-binding GntR family transcriptional regulator